MVDEKVFVFDKHGATVFRTSVREIAAERGFYDLGTGEDVHSLDPALQHVESAAGAVLQGVIAAQSLADSGREERTRLAVFAATLFLRVKRQHVSISRVIRELGEEPRRRGYDPSQVVGFPPIDAEQAKGISVSLLADAHEFVPYFLEKPWALLRTVSGGALFISDNPVVLQNERNLAPYGTWACCARY